MWFHSYTQIKCCSKNANLICYDFIVVLRIVRLDHVIRLICYGFHFDSMVKCDCVGSFLTCDVVS